LVGNNGFVWQVLPAYDFMKFHIERSLDDAMAHDFVDIEPGLDDEEEPKHSRMEINIMNAQSKLKKYRQLLTSPVYIVAMVLIPWIKWEYCDSHWTESEVHAAKVVAQKYWDDHYHEVKVGDTSSSKLEPVITKPGGKEPGLLQAHIRRRRVPKTKEFQDEYTRYCLVEPVEENDWHSALLWWEAHEQQYPRLTQMAKDILSIPGMSAEVERLFSSAKLMLPPTRSLLQEDGIEAGECIRSWIQNQIISVAVWPQDCID
jgi:hypothetical protein